MAKREQTLKILQEHHEVRPLFMLNFTWKMLTGSGGTPGDSDVFRQLCRKEYDVKVG